MSGESTKVYRDTNGDRQVVAAGGEVYYNTEARVTKSADYTLTLADSGKVIDVDTDGKVITLPATVVGAVFRIRNAGADGTVAVTVSPDAADKIQGVGLTAADDKDVINTKASACKGDLLELVGDGADGWFVTRLVGTWAREA